MFKPEAFKKIRKLKKISQRIIAKQVGKTRITVINWEQGKYAPCESDIRILADFLGVKVNEISDIHDNKMPEVSIQQGSIDGKIDRLIDKYGDIPPDILNELITLRDASLNDKATISRLRDEIARHNIMLHNLPFIFYVKNYKLKYDFVNEAFLNLVGMNYNQDKVKNTGSLELFGFNDYHHLLLLEQEAFRNKEYILNHQITIPGTHAKRTGLLNIIPVIEHNGTVSEIMCSIRDITDTYEEQNRRKELEELTNKINHHIWIGHTVNGRDSTFKYSYVSNNISEVVGIKKQDILNDNRLWIKMVYEKDYEKVSQWDKIKEFPKKIKYRINTDSGLKWISNEVFKEGENTYYGIVADITEELKLQEDKQLLLDILEEIPESISVVGDYGKKLVICNSAMENMTGITKKTLMTTECNEEIMKLIHPDDKDRVMQYKNNLDSKTWWKDKSKHAMSQSIKYRINRNNQVRWLNASNYSTLQLKAQGIRFSVLKDITEEEYKQDKLIQIQQLAEINNLSRIFLDKLGNIYWAKEYYPEEKYLFISEGINQILGFPPKDITTELWMSRIHPADHKKMLKAHKEVHKKEFWKIYRLLHKNGAVKWVKEFKSVTYTYAGKKIKFGFIQDITYKFVNKKLK